MLSSPNFRLLPISLLFVLLTAGCILAQAGEIVTVKCWGYATGELVGTRLATDGSRIFVGYQGGTVESLSADGKAAWASEFGGEFSSNILPTDDGIALTTSVTPGENAPVPAATLRMLSKETGITIWNLKLPGAESTFLGSHNGSLVVVSTNGVIQALDAKTGVPRWKREIADGFVAEPVFNSTKLTIAGRGRQVFLVSMATGEMESMRKSQFELTALGETNLGQHVTGDTRGNVTSFDGGLEKPNWKFKTGGAISSFASVGDSLLVTSDDNFIYLLTSNRGGVAWKRRLSGRVAYLTTLRNRYIFAAATEENGVTVTDASSGKSAATIGLGEGETMSHDPVVMGGRVLLMTDRAIYAYSIGECK